MDQTDIRIVNLLQKNCKITIKEIGSQVGLTSPAVTERIRRLEERGIIEGYHARIDHGAIGNHRSAFMTLEGEPVRDASFCRFCEEHPAITEHHHIIGVYNSLLRVVVPDTDALENLLRSIKKYGNSQTSTLLSTYFSEKQLPCP